MRLTAAQLRQPGKDSLAKGSARVSLMRTAGVACSFLVTLVIARTLGAEESGIYFLAVTMITIVTSLVRLGIEHAITRIVSVGIANDDWPTVNGAYMAALLGCSVFAALTSLLLYALAQPIASAGFGKPYLAIPIRLSSLAVLPTVVALLHAHALQGRKEVLRFVVLQIAGLQVLMLAGSLVLFAVGALSVSSLLVAYAAMSGALALLGLVWWWRHPRAARTPLQVPWRTLAAAAPPLFLVVALNLVLAWAGHLALGLWSTTADVAVFSAAYRISALLMLIATAITNTVAPEYAAQHAAGSRAALASTVRWATRAMVLASLLIMLPLFLFPGTIMGLMGPDFVRGGAALTMLVAGQALTVATGYPSFLLIMTGHERDLARNVVLSAALMFILTVLLVPRLGLLGAAGAQASSIGAQAILNAASIRRKLHISTWRLW